jgi:hypothetical protein
VRHLLARQVRRQRLAACRLVIPRRGAPRAGGLLLGLLGTRVALRHAFLEFAERHLELLDLAASLSEERPNRVRFEFEKAGKVNLTFGVQGMGAQGPTATTGSAGKMDMKVCLPG